MSATFKKSTARAKSTSGGPLGSLPFRGAVCAALLTGGAVLGSGAFATWSEEREALESLTPASRQLGDAIAAQISSFVDLEDFGQVESAVRHLGRNHPEHGVLVVYADGRVLGASGPGELTASIDLLHPRPHASGAITGVVGDRQVVESRSPVVGDRRILGEVRVRAPFSATNWMTALQPVAGGAAAFAFLFCFAVLRHGLRSVSSIRHALERAAQQDYFSRAMQAGSSEVHALAATVNETLDSLTAAAVRVEKAYVETTEALAKTVEAKDRYTSGHSQRVARYAVEMGEWLGFDAERLEMLRVGSLLHDIGKVAVPDSVLLKQGPLDDDEFEVMKTHPMAGDRILSVIPGLRDMADMARSHHERWDGRGYPMGVSGEAIPLEGRIVAIADAYDALVTKRCYKPAMPVEKALAIIEKDAGTHFDPELAKLFVSMKRNGKGYKALKKDAGAAVAPAQPQSDPAPASDRSA